MINPFFDPKLMITKTKGLVSEKLTIFSHFHWANSIEQKIWELVVTHQIIKWLSHQKRSRTALEHGNKRDPGGKLWSEWHKSSSRVDSCPIVSFLISRSHREHQKNRPNNAKYTILHVSCLLILTYLLATLFIIRSLFFNPFGWGTSSQPFTVLLITVLSFVI